MSSRVSGAGLALIAVALLAVSIATPVVLPAQLSLFAGHPTVSDHVRVTQDVYVGFYTAQLCNSGGDGTCKSGDATTGFRVAGYAELGLTALLVVIAVALAILTLRKSERRKAAAVAVWIAGMLALAAGGALILQGPFQGASAPLGIGMALQGAGIVASMLAGALAIRRPPPIRLRVADRGPQPAALPTAQAFAMRSPSGPVPASRMHATDPRLDPHTPIPRPAVPPADAELSDPFGAPFPTDRQPYPSSPQLRPLYDAAPTHGGTGGLLPIERPAIPARPPTPVSRAAINAATGLPMPPLPFAGEPRPMPRTSGADEPTAMAPPVVSAMTADDPVAMVSPFASDEARMIAALAPTMPPTMGPIGPTRPMGPPMAREERRTMPPPPPVARAKPPSLPPPLPTAAAPPAPPAPPPPPPPAHAGPRTQVSLVPPMPDNDLPIAPPTAQIVPDASAERGGAEPTLFPRAETPLAPPPTPVAPPPRDRRESQLPPPMRSAQPTRPPPPMRAAVPMPARPVRPAPSPTRPPIPTTLPGLPARPTLATTVPPIPPIPGIPPVPGIPAIPPIPPPMRAQTEVADVDAATVSSVPLEVGDYTSQTDVSVDIPSPEDGDAAGASQPGYVSDTSPSGEQVATEHPGRAAAPDANARAAVLVTSRPTIQIPGQVPPPIAVAPSISPVVRDRPAPKLPISTAPDSLPPPRDNKQASGPSPACPQCESPMAWVEEHLRFYCKSCRMYF